MNGFVAGDLRLVPRRQTECTAEVSNVFSVDVEEWFQVGAFETTLSRADWPNLESRVDYQTNLILDLLDAASTKATFFCLGWVAKRTPELIQLIASRGHEVACHGMDHERVFRFSDEEFLADVSEAKKLLEDASGSAVLGYRAPSFSMSQSTWSFYKKLIEAGFKYSSSVVPAQTDHYGAAGLPRVPFYPLKDSCFVEVPMTVAEVFGRAIPASGGGYFRLLPSVISKWLMNRARSQTGIGTIFYMHPWEVDPDQPFISEAPLKSRLRHYSGQSSMAAKISALLAEGKYLPMTSYLKEAYQVDGSDVDGD